MRTPVVSDVFWHGSTLEGTISVPRRSWTEASQPGYGRTTQKGSTVYLHIFDWPQGPLEVNGLASHVVSATLLAGRKALQFKQEAGRLTIQAKAPDANPTVIALETK